MAHPILIPEHETEVVSAGIRRTGDPDAVSTTALREIVVRGARVSSQHRKAHELALMARIVNGMPNDLAPFVRGIRCMSEHGRVYAVALWPWDAGIAREVAGEVDRLSGGHGGLDVHPSDVAGRATCLHVDAHWPDDFEDDDGVP